MNRLVPQLANLIQHRVRLELPGIKVGFVALRQNKPVFSGRLFRFVSVSRCAALRGYLSQRDKFYLVARPALLIAP